jgi:type I restriction enzyme S subunit
MNDNWDRKPLSDLLELVIDHRGKTPNKMGFDDFHVNGYPVLSAKHVKTDELVNMDSVRYANAEMYRKWMKVEVQKGDIVLTSEAPMGEVYYLDGKVKYLLGQRVFGLRPKNNLIDPLYLSTWLTSSNCQNQLSARASGTTALGIKQSELLKVIVDIPPGDVQKRIGEFRYNLSKKIALNIKTNETLDQLAKVIFKSWFVDFDPVKAKAQLKERIEAEGGDWDEGLTEIAEELGLSKEIMALFPDGFEESDLGLIPKGWKATPLDKIANYQNGLALQKFRPENEDDFLPVVKIAELKKGYADGEEKASPNIKPECIIDNGDIVFSWSGSLVVDIWCGGKAALNQHLFKVTSDKYPKWVYLLFTKQHLERFQMIAADKAVTMGHIKREHLSEALCAIPNDEFINKIGKFFEPNVQKIIQLRLENKELSKLRDTILPKLLSGEITIESTEE